MDPHRIGHHEKNPRLGFKVKPLYFHRYIRFVKIIFSTPSAVGYLRVSSTNRNKKGYGHAP